MFESERRALYTALLHALLAEGVKFGEADRVASATAADERFVRSLMRSLLVRAS